MAGVVEIIMDITIFHFGIVFFGFMTIYNISSARRYNESYFPAIIGALMFISTLLLLLLPRQYGSVAFLFTALFTIVNRKKIQKNHDKRIEKFIEDDNDNEPLNIADFFTGWKLLHRLNHKYGPKKASLIISIWVALPVFLIFLIASYVWPGFWLDIFSGKYYLMGIIAGILIIGYYRQNKKLLEKLDSEKRTE